MAQGLIGMALAILSIIALIYIFSRDFQWVDFMNDFDVISMRKEWLGGGRAEYFQEMELGKLNGKIVLILGRNGAMNGYLLRVSDWPAYHDYFSEYDQVYLYAKSKARWVIPRFLIFLLTVVLGIYLIYSAIRNK